MSNSTISALSSASTPLTGSEIVPLNQSGVTNSVSVANLTAGRAVSAASLTTTGKVGVGISATYQLDVKGGTNVTGSWYTTARFENSAATQGIHLGYNTSTTNSMVVAVEQGSGLELWTNNNAGGGWTSKFTVSANGDVTFTTGNVVQGTAGKGINFTANTPASGMTSQNLNWYEEGTWTPLISANGSGSPAFVSTTATGRYVRVGKTVTLTCVYTYTSIGTVGNNYAFMTGLPFASANNSTPAISSIQILQTAFDTKNYQGIVLNNSSVIAFQYNNGGGTLYAGAPYMVGNSFPAVGTVGFVITYICA